MPIEFRWDNDEKTVMRFTPSGRWNWNEFHKYLRLATFQMDKVTHGVEWVIDFTQADHMPVGAFGHLRSLGKRQHPNGRDRLLIIGLEPTVAKTLGGEAGVYELPDRLLRFVEDEAAAQAVLQEWVTAAE